MVLEYNEEVVEIRCNRVHRSPPVLLKDFFSVLFANPCSKATGNALTGIQPELKLSYDLIVFIQRERYMLFQTDYKLRLSG